VGGEEGEEGEKVRIIPTRLYPLKSIVSSINRDEYVKLSKEIEEVCYEAIETETVVYSDTGDMIESEVVEECEKYLSMVSEIEKEMEISQYIESCFPIEKRIYLKVGAQVMLTYNLDIGRGLCNGSLGKVIRFITITNPLTQQQQQQQQQSSSQEMNSRKMNNMIRLPVVKFMNGVIDVINPVSFQWNKYPIVVLMQIPLKLAWAMTIHGSQGSTLDCAEVDVGSAIFAVGQTYVALSRVKTLNGLYLRSYDPTRIKVSAKVLAFYDELTSAITATTATTTTATTTAIPLLPTTATTTAIIPPLLPVTTKTKTKTLLSYYNSSCSRSSSGSSSS
jgi:ATP-dependent DNA helicase PIF1